MSLVDQLLRRERLGAGVRARQARLDDDLVAVLDVAQVLGPVGVVVGDDDLGAGEVEAHRRGDQVGLPGMGVAMVDGDATGA